ncbi:hypothetical protein PanWU01x14_227590, partial [Parasponia andersonii]
RAMPTHHLCMASRAWMQPMLGQHALSMASMPCMRLERAYLTVFAAPVHGRAMLVDCVCTTLSALRMASTPPAYGPCCVGHVLRAANTPAVHGLVVRR